jgi:hypothetical protein
LLNFKIKNATNISKLPEKILSNAIQKIDFSMK